MIFRPDEYSHNNPDLAFVDTNSVRGGNRTVADLTALYALSSKSDQLKQYVTRVFVQSNSKWYTLIDINNIGSSLGWAVDQATNLQGVTDAGATTTNAITTAGLTITGGNGLVTTSQFYASASNITNSIFVGYDSFAVYLGYQMGSIPVHIGTGGTGAVVLRNTGAFQVESLAGTGTRMVVASSDGTISTQSIPTNAVTSVFGRTGAVTAQSGDYTTAQVTESGNLYYTDARARAALSFSAGSGGYNSTTGVISIPTSSSNISEGSNLYFTEQRVRDSVLTGLNITGGSVVSTDSVLSAFGKIQNQINGLLGGSVFQSTWNASTNSPTLTSSVGTKGHYYIVATAGTTNLNGITDWQVGDWAIFDGSVWRKVDNTDAVVSVNGFTGAVSLTTSNISEGSNLYYTDARSRASISINNGAAAYNSSTGVITIPSTTAHISESGNLFYTDARSRAALSFSAGSGAYNSSTGVITIPTNTNQLTNGAGFITGNQTITLSGDATGSGTTSIAVTLANSGVTAGTYTKVTVDAKGRVTTGASLASSDVTTALGYTPPQPNGTGATGTWNINILGNANTATTATTAITATNWSLYSASQTTNINTWLMAWNGTGWGFANAGSVQSFLGLGSYAYRSSGLAELSGATFTGTVNFRDGSNTYPINISGNGLTNGIAIGTQSGNFATIQGYNTSFTATNNISLQPVGGNVGIGTTSPSGQGRLTVLMPDASNQTGLVIRALNNGGSASQPALVFENGSSSVLSRIYADNGTGYLAIQTGGTDRLTISNSTGAATFSSTIAASGATFTGQIVQSMNGTSVYSSSRWINANSTADLYVGTGGNAVANVPLRNTGYVWVVSNADLAFGTNDAERLRIAASGAITAQSSITATSFFESSDIRLKDVIKEVTSFTGINTIFYNWKDRRDHLDHIGYSAQQVEEILPYAVSESNGYKTVDYNQVHTFKIMLLEEEIKGLKDELKQYKNGVQ